ncbi:MAG: Ig-like domain-containing protein [Firmicutes bacterium]|nr:Ig-like domain-containing protein [Bacillota bacterium]
MKKLRVFALSLILIASAVLFTACREPSHFDVSIGMPSSNEITRFQFFFVEDEQRENVFGVVQEGVSIMHTEVENGASVVVEWTVAPNFIGEVTIISAPRRGEPVVTTLRGGRALTYSSQNRQFVLEHLIAGDTTFSIEAIFVPPPVEPVLPQSVTISGGELQLNVNSYFTLTASVYPLNATPNEVAWTSGNTAFATVDSNGVVTGVAPGHVTITATITGSVPLRVATREIEIIPAGQSPIVSPTGVAITGVSAVNVGETTAALTATVSPQGAYPNTIVWYSEHPLIATVDATGRVTGISEGQATIRATVAGTAVTNTRQITVNAPLQQERTIRVWFLGGRDGHWANFRAAELRAFSGTTELRARTYMQWHSAHSTYQGWRFADIVVPGHYAYFQVEIWGHDGWIIPFAMPYQITEEIWFYGGHDGNDHYIALAPSTMRPST